MKTQALAQIPETKPGGDSVVRLSRVVKVYKAGDVEVSAIKGISFDIPRLRFSMIVGPSGSGKTTLLNLIGCIDKPTQGTIFVGAQDVGTLSDNAISDFRAQRVGFIFQNFSLIPVLSAWENIEYPLMLQPARRPLLGGEPMLTLKIAFRNIFRNTRRSLTTLSTIAIGATAVLVFGAYITYIQYGVQTTAVQRTGHLQVFRNGYFNYGTAAPADWGIDDYQDVLRLIREDPELRQLTAVVTPIQSLAGIAGNFENDTSRPFFGTGFVPSDRDRMKEWNEYGTGSQGLTHSGLNDNDLTQGITGAGLVRILGLCDQLHHLDDCPPIPKLAARQPDPSTNALATPAPGPQSRRPGRTGKAGRRHAL